MNATFFVVVSNTRSGSTYLATTLNELSQVTCDFQANWYPKPRKIDDFRLPFYPGCDVLEILRTSLEDSIARGTKLTFNAQSILTSTEAGKILDAFSQKINIIQLRRNYLDIYASRFGRGTVHILNPDRDKANESKLIHSIQNIQALTEQADFEMDPLDSYKAILLFFCADAVGRGLRIKADRGYQIRYERISEEIGDIARFLKVPYRGPEIESATNRPVVKKLPPLDFELLPNIQFAREVAAVFERAYDRLESTGENPVKQVACNEEGYLKIAMDREIQDRLSKIWQSFSLPLGSILEPGLNRIKNIDMNERIKTLGLNNDLSK
ncbi:hypothetical protein SCOR_18850 [Sulfidibacter corallicola]|uniref:Uncharacterized protein n=1 Tax=Sulfidibacter corallicola TaxID=2818388 RepID=A0A8A4TWJ2_SULCO|nr:hypothetical protein [Sulfidibacter corallicola]QTD53494.1 hypothetical protein J3U87_13650 [Sulfidibacter corallicola]